MPVGRYRHWYIQSTADQYYRALPGSEGKVSGWGRALIGIAALATLATGRISDAQAARAPVPAALDDGFAAAFTAGAMLACPHPYPARRAHRPKTAMTAATVPTPATAPGYRAWRRGPPARAADATASMRRRTDMKTIGMLGGMSWESSAEYYRLANELVRDRLGGFHSARCVLYSMDFAEIERMQAEDRWDEAGAVLAEAAQALERAGAKVLLLCTNTMHKVADVIEAATKVPLLHIADTTAAAVRRAGLRRVALLGTRFTMEQPFLRERLATHGLEVLVPNEQDRLTVHRVIYDELVRGEVREESRRAYQDVIERLVKRRADGVILGCTELELLIRPGDAPVPVFPTTRLHVEAAVHAALESSKAQATG